MKTIKQILNFLIFRRKFIYATNFQELELLKQIKLYTKNHRNFEGKVTKAGFHLFYISSFVSMSPTKLPLVDISGKTTREDEKIKLSTKITLNVIPKAMFSVALGSIILFYFLDKYTENDFGGMSDTTFPLFILPFGYLFLILIYSLESGSCKNHFQYMIKTIEKVDKNEL